ncbi:MAG TPA: DUF1223 domain-containing protein, partial [Polyangiaceae bacterium]|jgi:hypothetical protein|nr:DUF1223 domain-containing protein [Polyangiaceae bacterium]
MRTSSKVAAIAAAFIAISVGFSVAHRTARAAPAPTPIVVELFSSEGCSSCPPADAFLRKLEQSQPVSGVAVLPLEFHVDYWNYLGWKDPFSKGEYSERQQRYAESLRNHQVFTPELIVQGTDVLEGADEDGATSTIRTAAQKPLAHVDLALDGDTVSVKVTGAPGDGADDVYDVWMAVTESALSTNVADGENRGRRLAHGPIVRNLVHVGRVSNGAFAGQVTATLDSAWKRPHVKRVVFVQGNTSRRIVGANAV